MLGLIHEYLSYNPETGDFHWKKSPAKRVRIGDIAGYKTGQGYRELEFRGCMYGMHRLAWWMVHGVLPKEEVDHINGIRDDNRICNLREASKAQNQHNRKRWGKGTSSNLKGSSFHKASGKWTADIQCNKKRIHLGLFDSAEEAHRAYLVAAKNLHGEFARI